MRILLLAASGYLGSAVCQQLNEQPHIQLTGTCHRRGRPGLRSCEVTSLEALAAVYRDNRIW